MFNKLIGCWRGRTTTAGSCSRYNRDCASSPTIGISKFFIPPIFLVGLALLFNACTEEARTRLSSKPVAFGQPQSVVVVADQDLWDSPLGDTFRFHFASAYLILPQPEPILDLKHYTPYDMAKDPIKKELRTYIFFGDITDESSETAKLMLEDVGVEKIRTARESKGYGNLQKNDKWAAGQLLIYMFGTSKEALMENILSNYPTITKLIQDRDREMIEATVYLGGENRAASSEVSAALGLNIKVPSDYFVALDDSSTVWIRKIKKELSSNILIHKLPYTQKSQLTYAGFKSLRNDLTKRYVTSEIPGSYMLINDTDLPMFVKPFQYRDFYAVDARGIWEMENDFMGGPFMSYLIHNPNNNELYLLDAFVFAPGQDKRNLMQNLELILNTVTF